MTNLKKCDIFTPHWVGDYMASFLTGRGRLLEPSVGRGDLLGRVSLVGYESVDVYDTESSYLDAIDLPVTKHCRDFLLSGDEEYDDIIMNPPYIRFQDMEESYREVIGDELFKGNYDIYYAFLAKCMRQLSARGRMVAIIPNAFLYTRSAKPLKDWLMENRFIVRVRDFGSEKIFPGVSVYTCILVLDRSEKSHYHYNDEEIPYESVLDEGGVTLGDLCTMSGGIATLRDSIFIHDAPLFDEGCWRPLRSFRKSSWVIYPYDGVGMPLDEDFFRSEYPKTYAYLCENREELALRDKGKKTYPAWFCWGRKQSLMPCSGECLLIPTFIDPKNFATVRIKDSLWYGSICLRPEGISLEDIEQILHENIDFIERNSSKRGGGWVNVSPTLLKSLRVPEHLDRSRSTQSRVRRPDGPET